VATWTVDLLVTPGPFVPIDSIDSIDAEPSMYRFHRRLASLGRVIRFDQRGMGMSSRVPSINVIGPKGWAEDAIAVMDAVGCEHATIFTSSFNATGALVLAADYPERVRGLVIVNGAARVQWAPDYRCGAKGNSVNRWEVAMEPDALEQGFDVLESIAPAVAGDDAFRTWWDQAGNRSASRRRQLRRRDTAATSPSTSRDRATSSCPARIRCTGSVKPARCSTRSKSSSPACAAGSRPNVSSPQSFSPISSAPLNAPPRSATTGGTPFLTTTTT
jgi:pimeloyl-ACP methyl ester carboxylesterase